VYGVSKDSVESHEKFARKYDLKMPLIADVDSTLCTAYGVLKEKNMYGKMVVGIERTTIIIGKDGRIAKVFPKVNVEGHAEEVLAAVRAMGSTV